MYWWRRINWVRWVHSLIITSILIRYTIPCNTLMEKWKKLFCVVRQIRRKTLYFLFSCAHTKQTSSPQYFSSYCSSFWENPLRWKVGVNKFDDEFVDYVYKIFKFNLAKINSDFFPSMMQRKTPTSSCLLKFL